MPETGTCTTEQKLPVSVAPETASGHPATIDGALTVTVRSGSGTVEQDPASPLTFKAVSGDIAEDTVYDIKADADLGEGVQEITDTFTLTVTSATAANFGFTVGAAEPK